MGLGVDRVIRNAIKPLFVDWENYLRRLRMYSVKEMFDDIVLIADMLEE